MIKQTLLLVVVLFGLLFLNCEGTPAATMPFCRQVSPYFSTGLIEIFVNAESCFTMSFSGQLYADLNAQTIRYDYTFNQNNGQPPLNQSVWADSNQDIAYVYDWDTGMCSSTDFPYPVGSSTLPDNTVYVASLLIGTQEVDSLFVPASDVTDGIASEIALTTGTCFPVSVVAFNTTSNNQILLTESYFNFVPMVPPYVFRLPDACKSSSLVRPVTPSSRLAPAIRRFLSRGRSFSF